MGRMPRLPAVAARRAAAECAPAGNGLRDSPRMVAQREQLIAAFGSGIRRAPGGAGLAVQMKPIRSGGAIAGDYDGLNGLESSYQSSWETEKKSVGVSYRMTNARTAAHLAMPDAVAHAHVSANGSVIAGVGLKEQPGAGGAQWIAPKALDPVSAAELTQDMRAQAPNPRQVTNIRKVSMATDAWDDPPHQPGPQAKVVETIYVALPGGFVERKKLDAALIYDIHTGDYRAHDMYASEAEAAVAANLIPMPKRAKPLAAPTATAESDEEDKDDGHRFEATHEAESAPPDADDKLARDQEKRRKKRERQKQRKRAAETATQVQAEVEPSDGAPPAATGIWSYIDWVVGLMRSGRT